MLEQVDITGFLGRAHYQSSGDPTKKPWSEFNHVKQQMNANWITK